MNSFQKRSRSFAGQGICVRANAHLIKPRSRFTSTNQIPSHSLKLGTKRQLGNRQEKSFRNITNDKFCPKKVNIQKSTKRNKPKIKLIKKKKKITNRKCLGKKNSKNKKRTVNKTNNVNKVSIEPKKESEKLTYYPFLFNEKYESIPIRSVSESQLKINKKDIQDNKTEKPNNKKRLKRNSGTYKKMPFFPGNKVTRSQSFNGIRRVSRKKDTKIETMIESIF